MYSVYLAVNLVQGYCSIDIFKLQVDLNLGINYSLSKVQELLVCLNTGAQVLEYKGLHL